MLLVDILSWVVAGLVIGAGWAYFASGKGLHVFAALISGTLGALLGGFVLGGTGVHGKYNIGALVASVVGALVVLLIYSSVFFRRTPQPPARSPS